MITNYRSCLSEKVIEQMLTDADINREEDEKEMSRMAAKSELMDYLYSIKRKLGKEDVQQKTSEECGSDQMEGHQ